MTNGSLMKIKSIAECSPWSITDKGLEKTIFCRFESGRFAQVLPKSFSLAQFTNISLKDTDNNTM